MTHEHNITYSSQLEVRALREAIDEAASDARANPRPSDPSKLRSDLETFSSNSVDVTYTGSGLSSESIELIIGLTTAGPAYDIWRYIILPRIIDKFGKSSIVEKRSSEEND